MRNRVLGKAVLLVILAVVLAVLMDYFVLAGDAGALIKQYMDLDSAGSVQSSKEAFRGYAYQIAERVDTVTGSRGGSSSAMGQALADAAYGEYIMYQDEKSKRNGRGFGSWIYPAWYREIRPLDLEGDTFDDIHDRENLNTPADGTAWCAMFYSCMAQSVQRGSMEVLLYGSLCERLYGEYCKTAANVVFCEDSYLMEHLLAVGSGEDVFYGYVERCLGGSMNREEVKNKVEPVGTEGFIPRPGDLVFFHWFTDTVSADKWITHIGIVYGYDPGTGTVTVVEGNRNGNHNARVSEVACTEYRDNAEVWAEDKKNFVGYVRPAY